MKHTEYVMFCLSHNIRYIKPRNANKKKKRYILYCKGSVKYNNWVTDPTFATVSEKLQSKFYPMDRYFEHR